MCYNGKKVRKAVDEMFKIGICDDNITFAEKLKVIIDKYSEENCIPIKTYVYYDGAEVLEDRVNYDVLFLDVEMPIVDGIETAKTIRKRDAKVKIVYVTNHTRYMYNAFDVHAFQYLVKPFYPARVNMILNELFDFIEKENKSHDVSLIVGGELKVFSSNDIYYFERVNRKIKMITTSETYNFSGTLTDIMEKVQDYSFEYCHKSIIVNLLHCKRIDGNDLHLTNNDILPIAQKRSAEFKMRMFDYIDENFKLL